MATNGSADGSHTVDFTATDAAGNNSTPASVTFHLDTTAPVVQSRRPTDNQTFGDNPTITGTATDNQTLTGLTASVDGGAAQNVTVDATGNWTFTTGLATDGSADGTHTVTFIGYRQGRQYVQPGHADVRPEHHHPRVGDADRPGRRASRSRRTRRSPGR